MNRKIIGTTIIILAILLMITIIYFIFYYDFNKEEKVIIEKQEAPAAHLNTTEKKEELKKEEPKKIVKPRNLEVTSGDLERIALSFSERFGSYSNHSDFRNILDLKIFMSKSMQSWADKYVKSLKEKSNPTDVYFGVTTKSVTSEVVNFDKNNNSAEILIKTQRKESTGTLKNARVYYQDIIVKFIKEDKVWRVNSAYWEK